MQALSPDDAIVATYREHGHALVRGVPMTAIMAEMYGKREGCSRRSRRVDAFVRCGSPLLRRQRHRRRRPAARRQGWRSPTRCRTDSSVTACFFGDGAVAEGEFHESHQPRGALEAADPVHLREQSLRDGHAHSICPKSETDLHARPRATAFESEAVDGMDVVAVEAAGAARGRRRSARASGPQLSRMPHLSLPCAFHVRPPALSRKEEVEEWKKRDPIERLGALDAPRPAILHRGDIERRSKPRSRRRSMPPSPSPKPAHGNRSRR